MEEKQFSRSTRTRRRAKRRKLVLGAYAASEQSSSGSEHSDNAGSEDGDGVNQDVQDSAESHQESGSTPERGSSEVEEEISSGEGNQNGEEDIVTEDVQEEGIEDEGVNFEGNLDSSGSDSNGSSLGSQPGPLIADEENVIINEDILNVVIQQGIVEDSDSESEHSEDSDSDFSISVHSEATDEEDIEEPENINTRDDQDDGEEDEYTEEEDEDNSSESEEELDPADEPLYPGSPLTVAQSLLAVMTFALTHSLTGECIVDLLKLISIHCIAKENCITSLYMFKQFFSRLGQNILIFHYYCSGCEITLESKDSVCEDCNGANPTTYFIEFPILRQLQAMLLRPSFYENLQFRFNRPHTPGHIHDIYDGNLYKSLFDNNGFLSSPQNISFMWYSDGMAIYHSSQFSLWPLYLVINELPFKERIKQSNMILAGLWFGSSKPNPNLFLGPFRQTFQTLRNEGVEMNVHGHNNPLLFKACLLCGTGDMPAKSLFLRFKYYNGYYGCPRCKSAGGRYPVGLSSVHVHPYERNLPLRSHEEVPVFATAAFNVQRSVYGVKGLSVLYHMMIDMISGIGIDAMHGIFLGHSKLLIKLWFATEHNGQPFSISGLLKIVDERLRKMHPPSFVQRMPRSIEKCLVLWKAQEFKLWLLYYSIPCLTGLLPDEYLDHHMKLLSAVFLLSQESIAQEQVVAASNLFHEYVREFQRLYGLRYMGINVHQMLHLSECVLDLGPLWVYSCFPMEDLNGKLTRLIHGTRYAALQVCSGASTLLNLSLLIDQLPRDSDVRSFCENLARSGRQYKIAEEVDAKTSIVGIYKSDVPYNIQCLIRASCNIVGGRFQQFFRLRKRGVMYFSRQYGRANLKLSCFVSCTINNQSVLCELNHLIRWSDCNCQRRKCLCQEGKQFICVCTEYRRIDWQAMHIPGVRLSYISKVTRTNTVHICGITDIRFLCFYMCVGENEYIAEPMNSLEVE